MEKKKISEIFIEIPLELIQKFSQTESIEKNKMIMSLMDSNVENCEIFFPSKFPIPKEFEERFRNPLGSGNSLKKYPLIPELKLNDRSIHYLQWLKPYMTAKKVWQVIKLLRKDSGITLSHIDWLCTNYSKAYPCKYSISYSNRPEKVFDVHESYLESLSIWFRDYFDVFCRKEKIMLVLQTNNEENLSIRNLSWDSKKTIGIEITQKFVRFFLITSVAQMNFFNWAFEYGVVEFCKSNLDVIKENMISVKKNVQSVLGKRRKLSEPSFKSVFYTKSSTLKEEEKEKIEVQKKLQT